MLETFLVNRQKLPRITFGRGKGKRWEFFETLIDPPVVAQLLPAEAKINLLGALGKTDAKLLTPPPQ